MPKLKKEHYQQVIEDYLSGMTQKEVGIKNGIGRCAVGEIIRARGLETRSYTGERVSNKKWFWDKGYFKNRTPEVAYWAGFMMADGSLNVAGKNSYVLVFALQQGDVEHLNKFRVSVGLPEEYEFYEQRDEDHLSYRVHLSGINLADDLLYWGIVLRKTYNFVEPLVSDELLPHYLRGWADGDGQIYATGSGARFTVSGNTQSLEWYAKALKRLGYSGNVQFQRRNVVYSVLYVGGINQVSEVIGLLCPTGNELRMERKWNVNYETKYNLIDTICENCGKSFGVKKYRHEHPTFGRFCSEKCHHEDQKRKVVDGKVKCATCQEWKLLTEMFANPSYCKVCWNKRQHEYKKKA